MPSVPPKNVVQVPGGTNQPGAFCGLYEERVRYALRAIADGRHNAYLWDGWDRGTETLIDIASL
jgi:uncharacterized protein